MTKRKAEPSTESSGYTPSPHEEAALETYMAKRAADRVPRVKVLNENKTRDFTLDHPHTATAYGLLAEALGIHDKEFLVGLVAQLFIAVSARPQTDEFEINFMLSVVKGIQPRDRLEAMLAAQMAAVHMATMTFARRLAEATMIPQLDSAERAFNKLARTFATLMDALKRHRTGGESKITVQHVSVSQGGQAIVGNVTQGSRETPRNKSSEGDKAVAATPALADSQMPAMTVMGEPAPAAIPLKRKSSK
jgi:hypothetical protein